MGFLHGKRVVVTGGAGFLGRHVCQALQSGGPASVRAPRSAEYDLRDADAVRRLYRDTKPDVVLHLAAVVGGIEANRLNPGRYLYENALMGLHITHEAMRAGVAKLVSVGTICSYPKHTPVPFREDHLWDGYPEETNAPYGLAKKLVIVQAQAYRQQYGLNAVSLLPVNLYGPHDNFDPTSSHVIPALIRKALEARDAAAPSMEVWGTGNVSREFLFVRDAAEGIVLAAERYDSPEPANLGSGKEILIRDLVGEVTRACGYSGKIVFNAGKPDGQPRRCLDTTRARDAFGFTARTTFADGLRETVEWYEKARREPLPRVA